jgi:hypothetical protein
MSESEIKIITEAEWRINIDKKLDKVYVDFYHNVRSAQKEADSRIEYLKSLRYITEPLPPADPEKIRANEEKQALTLQNLLAKNPDIAYTPLMKLAKTNGSNIWANVTRKWLDDGVADGSILQTGPGAVLRYRIA